MEREAGLSRPPSAKQSSTLTTEQQSTTSNEPAGARLLQRYQQLDTICNQWILIASRDVHVSLIAGFPAWTARGIDLSRTVQLKKTETQHSS